MTIRSRTRGRLLATAVVLFAGVGAARAQEDPAEFLKKSDIVFIGTVAQIGQASFPGVPVTPRTAIVRVDILIEKPKAVTLAPGDDVTVESLDAKGLAPDVQVLFYTQGWIFGDGVAVREVGRELLPLDASDDALQQEVKAVKDARQSLENAELAARLRAADAIVAGKVIAVRPTPKAASRIYGVSEHEADWQEAIVRVEAVIKGAGEAKNIVVRFPGSLDIAWYGVPKLKTDQEAVFVLQNDRASGSPRAQVEAAEVPTYTALEAVDVLPRQEADHIRALAPKQPAKKR